MARLVAYVFADIHIRRFKHAMLVTLSNQIIFNSGNTAITHTEIDIYIEESKQALLLLLLLLLLLFTYLYFSGKTLAAQEFQKSAIKLVWKCIQLWPIIINKTIMQQNRIKSLHHNGNPLE